MRVELIQALQLILMILIIISVTYHIAHFFKYSIPLTSEVIQYSEVKAGLSYSKELTAVECESYHRYEIWRFYQFS